ncbi:MAG: RNA polymerase sigma factor [Wenzhouxiangellaceae bacterium]
MKQAEHDMLVIDAQDGSGRALDALVRHHHRKLLRFAYSLCRDTALAQDAVQDAWIKVVGRLRSLDDPRAFRGWIYHAVRWRVLDLLKRSHRDDRSLEDVDAESQSVVGDLARDRRIDLDAAIAGLAKGDRETLQLFYVSGLSVPEIAVVLDIPAGTVKSRLHRARNQLRQYFEGEDHEYR